MLKIMNDLKPFFEDNYRRISVREYSRISKMSPPTASKLLEEYRKEGLLIKEEDRKYNFYYANKDSPIFIDISRLYWKINLKDLIKSIEGEFLNPVIILFGSLSKAEAKKDSDIDLAIFSVSKKDIDVNKFEKKLSRNIQIFTFKKRDDVDNKELLNNILNGYVLSGEW